MARRPRRGQRRLASRLSRTGNLPEARARWLALLRTAALDKPSETPLRECTLCAAEEVLEPLIALGSGVATVRIAGREMVADRSRSVRYNYRYG